MGELRHYAAGRAQVAEGEQMLAAWHAANIMNCWISKGRKVTPDQLLGKRKTETQRVNIADVGPDEFFARVQASMGRD